MIINKAYKFRMYPDKKQEEIINKTLGCTRLIYNYYLDKKQKLKIQNMIKNHNLSKVITDASLSEIIRQLEYKSKWKNKKMYKIDTYYPSSQICSKCGHRNIKTKNLSIR